MPDEPKTAALSAVTVMRRRLLDYECVVVPVSADEVGREVRRDF